VRAFSGESLSPLTIVPGCVRQIVPLGGTWNNWLLEPELQKPHCRQLPEAPHLRTEPVNEAPARMDVDGRHSGGRAPSNRAMQTGSRTRAEWQLVTAAARQLLLALFTLHCALWLVVAPVIPQLHLTFATHRHVYSLRLHQILDAGAIRRDLSLHGVTLEGPSRPSLAADDSPNNDSDSVCPFSNFVVPVTGVAGTGCIFTLQDATQRATLVGLAKGDTVVPEEVFRTAPKRSPPVWQS
jgi:hypothetical protein